MTDTPVFIPADDAEGQRQVDALLLREGIRRDPHLDYTCGIFDDNWDLIATGSFYGPTLRCLAVADEHRGEGLLNRLVSHLAEVQAARGSLRLFLYTKCVNEPIFQDLGFHTIARVGREAAFMENRRRGFEGYLNRLARKAVPGDRISAIVMNANPFTLGHRHLVEQAAAQSDAVHLFVLSEEAGPIPFPVRRALVQAGVADLPNVQIHDSGPYMISTATFPSYFLPDSDTAIRVHAELDLTLFGRIAGALNIRRRYVGQEPASRVTALYNRIMLEKLPAMGVECCEIPRLTIDGRPVSASTVRQAIHDGRPEDVRPLLPDSTWRYFRSAEAAPVIAAIRSSENVIHY